MLYSAVFKQLISDKNCLQQNYIIPPKMCMIGSSLCVHIPHVCLIHVFDSTFHQVVTKWCPVWDCFLFRVRMSEV